jgi:hypothetical protein
MTDTFQPSLRRCHPMGSRKRWIVPNVLLVPTLKFRDPIQFFIQVKVNNFSGGPGDSCRHRFHNSCLLNT